jgi:hypothetical protein
MRQGSTLVALVLLQVLTSSNMEQSAISPWHKLARTSGQQERDGAKLLLRDIGRNAGAHRCFLFREYLEKKGEQWRR